jgi:prepilin-type N-terminal cleavage/methylation domain-containing protein
MKKTLRFGFTLVELLVVIAIIGMLIALLLPAVQAAREAARRMQCTNHLKQIGIALHNYHDLNDAFPPTRTGWDDTTGGNGNHSGTSYIVPLLPFLEQQNAYEGIAAQRFRPGYTTGNTEYNALNCSTLGCPSDPGFKAPRHIGVTSSTPGRQRCCYVGSGGDTCAHSESAQTTRGFFLGGTGNKGYSTRKLLCTSFQMITDGTSNTIAVAETAASAQDNDTNRKSGVQAVASAGYQTPQNCLNAVPYGSFVTDPAGTNGRGVNYADGRPGIMYFQTIMPPNSPNCNSNATSVGHPGFAPMNMSTTSYHSGGVNGLYGDASVHFISDTINCGSMSTVAATSSANEPQGVSPYGVWGALGSIAGGESQSGH